MLEMDNQVVKQLAMSRNHQNEGDDKVAYMSIAYTEVILSEKQIDGLMGKFTYRSWFNINGDIREPMEWTGRGENIVCKKAFKDVTVQMALAKKDFEFKGCRLYVDDFKLLNNGDILVDIHLHVMGAKDSEWIAIGHNEYTELKLSLGDGVLIEKKDRKQRELPLEADPNADQEGATTTPLSGAHVTGASPERDMTHVYWQQGENGELGNGPRCEKPADCVEVDPPKGSASEAQQEETGKAMTPEEAADFESGVAKALGARKKSGSNVIDGRSERVKHQDRQRGRDGAH